MNRHVDIGQHPFEVIELGTGYQQGLLDHDGSPRPNGGETAAGVEVVGHCDGYAVNVWQQLLDRFEPRYVEVCGTPPRRDSGQESSGPLQLIGVYVRDLSPAYDSDSDRHPEMSPRCFRLAGPFVWNCPAIVKITGPRSLHGLPGLVRFDRDRILHTIFRTHRKPSTPQDSIDKVSHW